LAALPRRVDTSPMSTRSTSRARSSLALIASWSFARRSIGHPLALELTPDSPGVFHTPTAALTRAEGGRGLSWPGRRGGQNLLPFSPGHGCDWAAEARMVNRLQWQQLAEHWLVAPNTLLAAPSPGPPPSAAP